ncbi:hypothetical protein scyTo_0010558, partial [Scyliorhinus torazame]|nr:hypothetical protein [Scyliorhinus torazame]
PAAHREHRPRVTEQRTYLHPESWLSTNAIMVGLIDLREDSIVR